MKVKAYVNRFLRPSQLDSSRLLFSLVFYLLADMNISN